MLFSLPLNAHTRMILGQPNFACAPVAHMLRIMGYVIPQKAEEEQAAVIHWLLSIYLEHGQTWRRVAGVRLAAAAQPYQGA
jgi:hypothetical protein